MEDAQICKNLKVVASEKLRGATPKTLMSRQVMQPHRKANGALNGIERGCGLAR